MSDGLHTDFQHQSWTQHEANKMKEPTNFKDAVLLLIAVSLFSSLIGVVAFAFLVVLGVILAGATLFALVCGAVSKFQIK
jgi:hypothetical protein